jgi:hypothetical protein
LSNSSSSLYSTGRISNFPDSIFDRSRMSFINVSRLFPACLIMQAFS